MMISVSIVFKHDATSQRLFYYVGEPEDNKLFDIIADGEDGLFKALCDKIIQSWSDTEIIGFTCHGMDNNNQHPLYSILYKDSISSLSFEQFNPTDSFSNQRINTIPD